MNVSLAPSAQTIYYTQGLRIVDMGVDNAHKVLTVYAYFRVKPGQDLVSSDFLAIGDRQRWHVLDLQDGLQEARREGWIERGKRGWRLTTEGFAEAAKTDDHQFAR